MSPSLRRVLALLVLATSAPGWWASASEADATPPHVAATCQTACVRECLQNCSPQDSNWSLWSIVCSSKSECAAACKLVCRSSAPLPVDAGASDSSVAAVRVLVNSRLRSRLTIRRNTRLNFAVTSRHNKTRPCDRHKEVSELEEPPPSSPLESVAVAVDAGGDQEAQLLPALVSINFADIPDAQDSDGWSVEVASMTRQGMLVFTDLSWRPPENELWAARRGGGSPLFLVSWELDGGGITGNLYTDSSSVTLSLWANAVFYVQVELSRRSVALSRSSRLRLDTAGDMGGAPEKVAKDADAGAEKRSRYGFLEALLAMLTPALVFCCVAFVVVVFRYKQARDQRRADKHESLLCRCRINILRCIKCTPQTPSSANSSTCAFLLTDPDPTAQPTSS